jgi:hypothetical protein
MLGRKPKLTEHQKREAIRRRDRNGEPLAAERAAVPPVSQEQVQQAQWQRVQAEQ